MGMATKDDPLRGGAFDDQDMEDLTAHLANLPAGRSSHDGLDLGDNTELQGNMDRFRALAGLGDDGHDDLFTSFGGLGLGGGGAGGASSTLTTTTATANYPTYGELAAAGKPPSYEDSMMYEQAPLGLQDGADAAAAAAAGGGGAGGGGGVAARSDPLMGPWGGGGAGAGAEASSGAAASGRTPSNGAALPPLGGGSVARKEQQQQREVGPLGASPLSAAPGPGPGANGGWRGSHSGGGGPSTSAGAGSGAGPSHQAAAALLDPLALPGSGDYREDMQALSPQRTTPRHLASHPHRNMAALTISVTDPIKREAGGLFGIKGGYVTYLVKSKPRAAGSLSGAAAAATSSRPDTCVRRRFREFVALAELLKEKYRGYFVPPRPEKNAVEGQRMTDGFVEERRLALERYLNKLARHPVLCASEELRLFLESEGELESSSAWHSLRPLSLGGSVLDGTAKFSKQILGLDRAVTDPVQAAQPTKKATDFMRAIKETARSMQVPTSALPPDEVELQRGREELDTLQGGLTTASRAAERLVSRLDRWAVVHGELGLALFHLAKAEQADGVALAQHTGTLKQSGQLMHDTERSGTALVRASRIGRKVTGRCAIELGALHEYLGLMPAALKGLRARHKALLTADTLTADLEGRRRAMGDLEAAGAKVLGGDAAKAKKVAELAGDVSVLEQSILAARAQYDKIRDINQTEMSRLHGELRGDMLGMLQHYASIMEACARRNTEIWLQAANELQATPEQLNAARACLLESPAQQPLQSARRQAPHERSAQPHPHGDAAGQAVGSAAGGGGGGGWPAAAALGQAPGSGSMGEVDLHGPAVHSGARDGFPL